MHLTYLSIDSIQEGVGASQVLAYVERLTQKGLTIELQTFEKEEPSTELRRRLEGLGIDWQARKFGAPGSKGGLTRVLRGASGLRGRSLVHARSDLAAASALTARCKRWVWDFRSFYVDQKIELGELRAGSLQEKALRKVQEKAAYESSAIIVLTRAAIPVLTDWFGAEIEEKIHVVTTCVDTDRFKLSPLPPLPPLRLLLSGTVNAYYDVPLMTALVDRARTKLPTELSVIGPTSTQRAAELSRVEPQSSTVPPGTMHEVVTTFHAGLSVCREDAGISLKGAMPTKIGEFLATGRPVIVNPGLGDIAETLSERNCGVVVRGAAAEELDSCVDQLLELLDDSDTPIRCRELAMDEFDLNKATDVLIDVYRDVASA